GAVKPATVSPGYCCGTFAANCCTPGIAKFISCRCSGESSYLVVCVGCCGAVLPMSMYSLPLDPLPQRHPYPLEAMQLPLPPRPPQDLRNLTPRNLTEPLERRLHDR